MDFQYFLKSSHIDLQIIFSIILEAILGRLGANLEPSWAVLAPSWPPKNLPTSIQDRSQDEVQHSSKLRSNLEAFADPKIVEKPMKNQLKKTCFNIEREARFNENIA